MLHIWEKLTEFNVLSVAVRLLLACLLGGLIGLERGRHGRAAGLRTHILVCIGAAMTSLMSLYVSCQLGITGDVFRIPAQVISGIGFLGAGTILVRNKSVVTGLTTAAGVWCTASIGVAVGYGFYEGALICAVIAVITTSLLTLLEINQKKLVYFYVELEDATQTTQVVRELRARLPEINKVDVATDKSGRAGAIALIISLNRVADEEHYLGIFEEQSGVVFAVAE